MEIIIQPTAEAATNVAANLIAHLIRQKPAAVLGLATGRTPIPLYQELAKMRLDWRRIRTFNLDEYAGLPANHPQSFHRYMEEELFRHVNLNPKNTRLLDGLAADIPAECERYEQEIHEAGGIDLQLLGIGANGHIGFNEPGTSLASRTGLQTLTPQTRRDNAAFFGGEDKTPQRAISIGIGTILEARHCLLLAFGGKKARAVADAVEEPVSANTPASALQLHPNATLCLDENAAAGLKQREYYRWVYENKREDARPQEQEAR